MFIFLKNSIFFFGKGRNFTFFLLLKFSNRFSFLVSKILISLFLLLIAFVEDFNWELIFSFSHFTFFRLVFRISSSVCFSPNFFSVLSLAFTCLLFSQSSSSILILAFSNSGVVLSINVLLLPHVVRRLAYSAGCSEPPGLASAS